MFRWAIVFLAVLVILLPFAGNHFVEEDRPDEKIAESQTHTQTIADVDEGGHISTLAILTLIAVGVTITGFAAAKVTRK